MNIIQFDFSGKGPPDIGETVYDSLMGQLIPSCRLPWVESIFISKHPCYEEYCKMQDAYTRLRERLGAIDEDVDVEIIIDALLAHGKKITLEMFRCGREYQKMLHTENIKD